MADSVRHTTSHRALRDRLSLAAAPLPMLLLCKIIRVALLRVCVATDCGYAAKVAVVEMRRIELLTPCLQGRCSPS